MHINNISFKQHVVLGNTTIQFVRDAESKGMDKYLDMSISLGESDENTYTFFIGDNGVGKSVLFRTIIDYANSLYGLTLHKEEKYKDFSKWSRLVYENPSQEEDSLMELLRDYHILNTNGSNTFLKGNDAHLVHVSSAINEDYINGNSNRYYEMRTPNARLTQVMCMKAFRNTPKEYINKLLHYIERDNSKFNIDFNISTPSWSKEQKMIAVKHGLTIIDYIQLFHELSKDEYEIGALSEKYLAALKSILRTKSFHDYFRINNKDVEQILENINQCNLLKRLEDQVNQFGSVASLQLVDRFTQQAIGVCLETKEDISPLIDADLYKLSNEELLLLSILVELGMCDCNIEIDDTPMEKMSSGEQMFMRLYSLFGNLPKGSNQNIILLYDEPENSLHPKWQQLFPKYFQEIVEEIYGIKSSHFIFATHSPLIILKTNQLQGNVNVIKLYKNDQSKTQSEVIEDIPAYSIEELMMEEFALRYRSDEIEQEGKHFLDTKNDQMECVFNSDALREEIETLYNTIIK